MRRVCVGGGGWAVVERRCSYGLLTPSPFPTQTIASLYQLWLRRRHRRNKSQRALLSGVVVDAAGSSQQWGGTSDGSARTLGDSKEAAQGRGPPSMDSSASSTSTHSSSTESEGAHAVLGPTVSEDHVAFAVVNPLHTRAERCRAAAGSSGGGGGAGAGTGSSK